jgi:chemotaxis protein MotB
VHTNSVFTALFVLGTGCVSSGAYDAKVAELDRANRESALRQGRIGDLEAQVKGLSDQVADLGRQLAGARAETASTARDRERLQQDLDRSTALAGELKKRLESLGQNVNKLTSERGQLAATLDDATKRLEELRRQKAAIEARAAAFHELARKLRSMIDAGQLKVVIRNGRMLLALPNDVLFDSGRTDLKPAGKDALVQVAHAMASISDRKFEVSGHTDDVPIHTPRFPSNWELSTARAVEVTKLLISSGVRPEALSAAGYGEFDPAGPNDSPEHKAQNRRIEIGLLPNLAELPGLPDVRM